MDGLLSRFLPLIEVMMIFIEDSLTVKSRLNLHLLADMAIWSVCHTSASVCHSKLGQNVHWRHFSSLGNENIVVANKSST